jgi:hypothetical protein
MKIKCFSTLSALSMAGARSYMLDTTLEHYSCHGDVYGFSRYLRPMATEMVWFTGLESVMLDPARKSAEPWERRCLEPFCQSTSVLRNDRRGNPLESFAIEIPGIRDDYQSGTELLRGAGIQVKDCTYNSSMRNCLQQSRMGSCRIFCLK